MSFCVNCGKEILEGAKFCASCGTPIAATAAQEAPVVAPPVVHTSAEPSFANYVSEETLIKEEQEFLDDTHRLLRWERKAWSICGKVLTIIGIIFTAIFGFITFAVFIEAVDGDIYAAPFVIIFFIYTIIFGGLFLTIGIIQRKVANKMPIYLDSLYDDFTITNNRSGNVGMLVFSVFFGEVALVFFIINFVRLKANGRVIERILKRQGKI